MRSDTTMSATRHATCEKLRVKMDREAEGCREHGKRRMGWLARTLRADRIGCCVDALAAPFLNPEHQSSLVESPESAWQWIYSWWG